METTYIGATANELHTIKLNCHVYLSHVSRNAWHAFLINVTANVPHNLVRSFCCKVSLNDDSQSVNTYCMTASRCADK